MLTRLTFFLPLIAIGNALAAPDWQQANMNAVDNHVIPRYQQLAEATADLDQRIADFCRARDADGLDSIRKGYHRAMDAWQGIQHIRFGPVAFYLRHHRFQLWPDKRGTGAKQLRQVLAAEDAALLTPERFRQASVAIQGLSALERLLFDAEADAFFNENGPGYRCRLSEAIATNLATMSRRIVEEWKGGELHFREAIRTAPEGNDHFYSAREVTGRLLNDLHTQLQVIVDLKLGRPLGQGSGRLYPRRAESWRSRRSLENVALNLASAQALYQTAFRPLIGEPAIAEAIEVAFAETQTAARAIEPSLYEITAAAKHRAGLERLQRAAVVLQRTIAEQLSTAIGVPLGFNGLDGD